MDTIIDTDIEKLINSEDLLRISISIKKLYITIFNNARKIYNNNQELSLYLSALIGMETRNINFLENLLLILQKKNYNKKLIPIEEIQLRHYIYMQIYNYLPRYIMTFLNLSPKEISNIERLKKIKSELKDSWINYLKKLKINNLNMSESIIDKLIEIELDDNLP